MAAMGAGVGLGAGSVRRALRRRSYPLEGRTVAITGGSRGLGFALARACAREGAQVAICARDQEELELARDLLEREGSDVLTTVCDLRDRGQIERWLEEVREVFGPVDVLVNNAGVIQVGPLETMTEEDFQEAMDVHFFAPLQAMRLVLGEMRARKQGRIINISSFGGLMGVPHLAPYCASKFALTGLSESVRAELALEGVYVTTVAPFLMRTGSPRHAFFKGRSDAEYLWFLAGAVAPFLTMDPDRAAKHILEASRAGRAELMLTPHGKAVLRFKSLFPELTFSAMRVMAAVLPSAPEEGGRERREGAQIRPRYAASPLERLNRWAGERLNEYARS